ncbi:MAG: MFS transporter [Proteobacteria bacterium]|nr:MFS transporter [Pseudomonadota bacterium]MBI3495936.1 MFS transporter [Pseudomonadota bacterium]
MVDGRFSQADAKDAVVTMERDDLRTDVHRARALMMLSVMIVLAILSQFYRSSSGVIAPEIMHDLSINAEELGLTSSTFFIIFALLQIPIGVFFDRYGVRLVLPAMLLVAVLGSLIFSLAPSLIFLIVGRFLIGFGFAGLMVGSLVVLARWHSPARFTGAMTLLFASANAGSLLATLPLAAANEWIGWRATFFCLGILTALLTLILFLVVRDEPPGDVRPRQGPESLMESMRGLLEVVRLPGFAYVLPLVAVGYSSTITILGLWGGPYLHDIYGLDGVDRGNALSIMAMAMIGGTLAYGPLYQKFGTFRSVVIGGGVATGLIFLVLAPLTGAPLGTSLVLLVLLCFVGAYSLVVMAHGLALVPPALSGRGTTTLNASLMGGAAILQAVTGGIIAHATIWLGAESSGYSALFAFLGLLTLAAVAVYRHAPEAAPRA